MWEQNYTPVGGSLALSTLVAALPKSGAGKILKRDLREGLWTGKEARVQ